MNDEYQAAQKRARELASFYRRLVTYAVVIAFLAVIDTFDSSDGWWFYWVALFWGFFMLKRAWCVFGPTALFDKDWEERKIAELMGEKSKRKSKNAEDYFEEVIAR
jgi:hypothetical protein